MCRCELNINFRLFSFIKREKFHYCQLWNIEQCSRNNSNDDTQKNSPHIEIGKNIDAYESFVIPGHIELKKKIVLKHEWQLHCKFTKVQECLQDRKLQHLFFFILFNVLSSFLCYTLFYVAVEFDMIQK